MQTYTYIVSVKNIPNIFDCNLKKDYQILIIFGTNMSDTTGPQMTPIFHRTYCLHLQYLVKQNQRNIALVFPGSAEAYIR